MARRKPTTQEALDKLATLPDFETPPPLKIVPPLFRAPLAIPYIFDQGGKAIARVLIRADPLNRIDDSTRSIINDPTIAADNQGNIVQVMTDDAIASVGMVSPAPAKPRKVTKKMKMQRKIQSKAFKNANAKGRLQNGTFRAGFDQSRIARMAQKECTAERIRLGLCDDPKKKMKRKSKK